MYTIGVIGLFSWLCNLLLTCSVFGASACWNNVFFFFSVALRCFCYIWKKRGNELPWTCVIFSIGLRVRRFSSTSLPIMETAFAEYILARVAKRWEKARVTASRLLDVVCLQTLFLQGYGLFVKVNNTRLVFAGGNLSSVGDMPWPCGYSNNISL